MDDYPNVVITESDCERATLRAGGNWGNETWVDDHQSGTRQSLRWNGLLAEEVTLRYLGFAMLDIRTRMGGCDGGVDIRTRMGTAQIKFRSANHYGLSRPARTRRVTADFTILTVPGCSALDRKTLRTGDEICIAGWVATADFYRCADPRIFFGKPHLFMEQPLTAMPALPLLR